MKVGKVCEHTLLFFIFPLFQALKAQSCWKHTKTSGPAQKEREQERFKYLTDMDGLDLPNPGVFCRHGISQRKGSLSHQLHQSFGDVWVSSVWTGTSPAFRTFNYPHPGSSSSTEMPRLPWLLCHYLSSAAASHLPTSAQLPGAAAPPQAAAGCSPLSGRKWLPSVQLSPEKKAAC